LKEVSDGAIDGAKTAVTIALGLIGVMAMWLGVMRLAEKSGLVQKIARGLRPIMRRLFPDVPPEHPAMGSMLMNMAANMLGLGNAATPLGLRAMRDLDALNPRPGVATNAMCTFLAVNTASVQLIPTTAIAILVAAGSRNPTAIVGTSLLATLCAATVAITAVKLFEKLPLFRQTEADGRDVASAEPAVKTSSPPRDPRVPLAVEAPVRRAPVWAPAVYALLTLFFAFLFVRMVWPNVFGLPLKADASPNGFVRSVSALSILAIPFLLSFFPLYAAVRGIEVYNEFVEGAKEGFNTILRIIPFLVTMLVAINMFKGAGGIDLLTTWLAPVLAPLNFPPDLLPLALMRPLSGGATLAILTDVVQRFGPENIISLMAATIYGSTETTFYVAAVYFGSVGVKQTRHAIPAGLLADLCGVAAAVLICRLVFG
ncbi:MAG: nucleoside recognition protein, partial [Chthoniobacterales bacterium]|nr:nucleoside recognition protein [Chthoniobacterales bacterium]